MYVLENRQSNKIFHRGRDMFNKVKINDGLKEIKKDDEKESKFKHRNIPETKHPEYNLWPYKTPKRFQPDYQYISSLEELVKLFLGKNPHKDSSCCEKVAYFFMMHGKNYSLRKKIETQKVVIKEMQD